ncbi:SDR family oxidoreductase [soil metagenome]
MVVAIAGGHGKIGLRLTTLLAERGDRVLSIIRDPAQSDHVSTAGGEPVVLDLENAEPTEIARAIADADAVVFAAGAGPGSGAGRKETVDYGAAMTMVEAARLANATRYVIVSSMGADAEHEGEDVFDVYLRAKGRSDEELAASGLEYTIVRPGALTDSEPTGRVEIAESVGRGEISRGDVASVLAAVLAEPASAGLTFELVGGGDQIELALDRLAR